MTQYPRPMGSVAAVRAMEPAPAPLVGAVAYRQAEPCLSPPRYPGAKRRMPRPDAEAPATPSKGVLGRVFGRG